MEVEEARRQLIGLVNTLTPAVERDPDQEITGIAIPVLDAVFAGVKPLVSDSEVLQRTREVISPETIEEAREIRAFDALVVARAMLAALPPRQPIVG